MKKNNYSRVPVIYALWLTILLVLDAGAAHAQTWNTVGTPGFSAGQAFNTVMAIDAGGTPYVAFEDFSTGFSGQATVMKYDGTSWVTVGNPGFSAGVANYISIAIGAGGTPYVAYSDVANGDAATVMKYNGTSWVTVGSADFSTARADFTSIAIDGSGTPYVSYQDWSSIGGVSFKATVMKYNGSSWIAVGSAGFSAGAASYNSIAIDGSGTPYVVYQDGNNATVMKYSSGSWVTVGSAGFSAGTAFFTSIAIDRSGTPYVTYRDEANSEKATVMKFNGSSWVNVGSAGFTAGRADFTTIAIDGSGTPYVAYQDYTTYYASAMKFNGSSWVTAGNSGFSAGYANYTSIAIDGSGSPFVVYEDFVNSSKATVMKLGVIPSPITGGTNVCPGATTTLFDTASGGTWSSASTGTATVNSAGVVTGVAAGTVVISYSLAGITVTTTITVNPAPVITAGSNVAICNGVSASLNATGGITYFWSPGTGLSCFLCASTLASPSTTTTYTVTGTSVACSGTATVTVTVIPLPDAGTITGGTTVCAGSVMTLTDLTAGGNWNSSNTSVANVNDTGLVIGGTSGTTTISYTVFTGCGSTSATWVVTVNPLPDAGSINGTTTIHTGSATTLTDAAAGGIWSSGTASVAAIGSATGMVNGLSGGVTVITYAVTNSCGTAQAFASLTVNPDTALMFQKTWGGTGQDYPYDVHVRPDGGYIFGGVTNSFPGGYTSCWVMRTDYKGDTLWTTSYGGSGGVCDQQYINDICENSDGGSTAVGGKSVCGNPNVGGEITRLDSSGNVVWTKYCSASADPYPVIQASDGNFVTGGYLTGLGAGGNEGFLMKLNSNGDTIWSKTYGGTGDDWFYHIVQTPDGGYLTCGKTTSFGQGLDDIYLVKTDANGNLMWSKSYGTAGEEVAFGHALQPTTDGGYILTGQGDNGVQSAHGIFLLKIDSLGNVVWQKYYNGVLGHTVKQTADGGYAIAGHGGYTGGTNQVVLIKTDASGNVSWSKAYGGTGAQQGLIMELAPDGGYIVGGYTTSFGAGTKDMYLIKTDAFGNSGCNETNAGVTSTIASFITTNAATIVSQATTVSYAYYVIHGGAIEHISCSAALPLVYNVTGGGAYCTGSSGVTIGVSSSESGVNYQLMNGSTNVGSPVAGTGSAISFGTQSVAATYSVAATNVSGTGTLYMSGSAIVMVNPVPTAAPVNNGPMCVGGSVILFAFPGGGADSYTWTGPGGYSSTLQNPIVAPAITGAYSLIVTNSTTGCNSILYTTTVTVNAVPTAAPANSGPICSGASVTLTANPAGAAVNYLWTGPGGFSSTLQNPIFSLTVTGVYSLTVADNIRSGCSPGTVYTTLVTVSPGLAAISGTSPICVNTSALFTDTTSGGNWTSSAPGIASVTSTGMVNGGPGSGGTATISYSTGCGSATYTVMVLPAPASIIGAASICLGATASLIDAVAGGTWSSDNTGIATIGSTGIVTGVSAGSADITYSTGCGSDVYQAIVVDPLPALTTSPGAVICIGASATLSVTGGVAYSWSPAGSLSCNICASPVATPTVTTTYTISGTSSAGCVTTATVTVTVSPLPAITTGPNVAICNGASTTLNVTGGISYSWSPSAGLTCAICASPIATPSVTTTYTVVGINSAGCTTSATVTVSVNATSAGTITGPSSVFTGSNITLTDAVTGGVWSAGNPGATVAGGIVTGVAAGVVTISYAVTGSCGTAFATKVITVNNSSVAAISGMTSICAGASTTLLDATTGGTWSSGNGAIATVGGSTGIVTGMAAGTVNITYTAGGAYATTVVTVNPVPLPIQGAASECVGITVSVSDATAGGVWSSGNGSISVLGASVTGITAGTSSIIYTLPTGCSISVPNTIYADPVPITGMTTICVGGTTALTDATSGAISWTSSNTFVATAINSGTITGVAAGTATITYKILTGSCTTTTVVTVTATAGVITGNSAICAGAAITLVNASGAGTWSSSNAVIATVGSGSGIVTGVASGTATVTYLPAAGGCKSNAVVTVNAAAAFTGGTNICTGSTTTLSDASAGGVWISSNTGVATIGVSTGLVTGISMGSTVITYTLVSGCLRIATVNVAGAMSPVMGTSALCAGTAATLTDATVGGTWSISSALIASIGSATGVVTASGTYVGTATISYSAGGCAATRVLTVNSIPTPVQGMASECAGITVTLTDATAGGAWSGSGNIVVATLGTNSGTVTAGSSAGTGTVTYTLGTGCFTTYPNTVYANPSAIVGTFNVCMGTTTALTDATSGAISWTSSNTLVATAINSGAVTGVAAGTATITYKILTGSCIATQVVTVNAGPAVSAISGPAMISHATPATLSDITAGGVWSTSNAGIIALSGSTGSPVTASAISSSGVAVISYTLTNGLGCKTTAKLSITAAPAPPPHSTGVTSFSYTEEVLLYPNPTNGAINIKADVAGVFYLYAWDGKALGEYKIGEGVTNVILPDGLAKGIYMGRYLGNDGSTALFKIVRE